MRALPCLALLVACHKPEGMPLPAATTPEAVEILWDGAAFPGARPSVVRFDSAWHLYLLGREGSFEGSFHARSEDGLSFDLLSSHRVLDTLIDSDTDQVEGSVAYASGSRAHLLSSVTLDGVEEVWHATATDGDDFTVDAGPVFSSTEGDAYEVSGALYEAGEVLAALGERDGEREILVARSTDGGESFPAPELGLQPDDLPTPWGSQTVGAGGMWGATIAADPDEGYHMLYLGAAPNGDEALGIGQAWSGDGVTWTADGELWYAPEEGTEISGISLVLHDGGWWLWMGVNATGEDPLDAGGFALMRIE